MADATPIRRRSPLWVRESGSGTLHGILGTLDRRRMLEDLSGRQEWLWDVVVSELEYRWRRPQPSYDRCSCEWCIPPFSGSPDD